jgi:hypothetical protein
MRPPRKLLKPRPSDEFQIESWHPLCAGPEQQQPSPHGWGHLCGSVLRGYGQGTPRASTTVHPDAMYVQPLPRDLGRRVKEETQTFGRTAPPAPAVQATDDAITPSANPLPSGALFGKLPCMEGGVTHGASRGGIHPDQISGLPRGWPAACFDRTAATNPEHCLLHQPARSAPEPDAKSYRSSAIPRRRRTGIANAEPAPVLHP